MATPTPPLTQAEIDALNRELDLLNDKIDSIATSFSKDISSSLAKTSEGIGGLVSSLEKSEDITKKLTSSFKKYGEESRKNSLEQLSSQSKINDLTEQLKQKYDKKLKLDLAAEKVRLRELQTQEQLNEKVLEYLKVLEQHNEAAKAATEEKKKQNKLQDGLNLGMKAFSALGLGSLVTIEGLMKAFFDTDNAITQMGKSLGVSKEIVQGMKDEMYAYSRASNDSFVNVGRLLKAQEGLTEQLGIAVDFGNEERETFARLTEITGLSADEAGKLATFSAATGKSTKSYVSDLRVASMEASRANKIHISDKELLSTVSKLSAGILTKFQGNPKAIAAAVVEAKKLGTNLETVNKIGDSLLDWESSIENELEAELITGKKINLERAREAALSGNQLDLTREIADQVGTLSDYQNMNVIAQSSLAKAFGLSRDEMSEMLMKQEAINKYGDKAADLNKEQLEDMERRKMTAEQYLAYTENQRSTQEKFNDLITKMQDIMVSIAAGPLGTIMKGFSWILEQAWLIYPIITAIGLIMAGNLVSGVMAFGKGLMAAIAPATELAAVETEAAIASTTAAEATSFGAATLWIVGGLAAVAGAMAGYALSSKKSMKDGVMGPSGKVLYSGAEGAISLGANDTVVAGTNLGGGGGDNNALLAAINDLHSTMKTKSNDIYMDSQKVGTQVGRQTSTGTQQSINSYKLA
jgi:hypothetical protein